MKTLEEKLLEMKDEFDLFGTKFNELPWQRIEKHMKEYADEYAKEALRLASDNATIIEGECGEFGEYIPTIVDKKSILSETNLPKHI